MFLTRTLQFNILELINYRYVPFLQVAMLASLPSPIRGLTCPGVYS